MGLALISVALLFSGSRGGVIAAVLSFAVALFLSYRWRPWSRPRVQTVIVISAASVITVVASAFAVSALFPGSRAAAIVVSDPIRRLATAQTGSSGRAEIWTGGLLACRSSCAVGAGVGGFRDAYADVFPFSSASRNVGTDRPAHNVYLETAVELGVVGLALFGAAIALEWWSLRRLGDALLVPAVGAGVAGVLITNVFEGFLWFKHAWLPFLAIRVIESARAATTPALSLGPFTPPAHGSSRPAFVRRPDR